MSQWSTIRSSSRSGSVSVVRRPIRSRRAIASEARPSRRSSAARRSPASRCRRFCTSSTAPRRARKRRVEAAGLDRRELLRVADEDELGAGSFGEVDESGEVACPHHGCFVADDDRPGVRLRRPWSSSRRRRAIVVEGMPLSASRPAAASGRQGAADDVVAVGPPDSGGRRRGRRSCPSPARRSRPRRRRRSCRCWRIIVCCSSESEPLRRPRIDVGRRRRGDAGARLSTCAAVSIAPVSMSSISAVVHRPATSGTACGLARKRRLSRSMRSSAGCRRLDAGGDRGDDVGPVERGAVVGQHPGHGGIIRHRAGRCVAIGTVRRSMPARAASCRQRREQVRRARWCRSFAWRVLSAAVCGCSLAAGSGVVQLGARSRSVRFENCRRADAGMPAMSAAPLRTGSKPTPSRLSELVAEDGLVQVAGRSSVDEEVGAVQRRVAAVVASGEVDDQDVGVDLRVAAPGR